MIFLIVGIIIGAVLLCSALATEGVGSGIFGLVLGGILGVGLGLIVALVVGAIVYGTPPPQPQQPVQLVSLADGAGIEGHFFLGSGSVSDIPVFTWYEKNGSNSYVRRRADADETTIHYLKADEKPYYVFSPHFKELRTWGFALRDDEHYDFYVPKGSIVQSYRLDNK